MCLEAFKHFEVSVANCRIVYSFAVYLITTTSHYCVSVRKIIYKRFDGLRVLFSVMHFVPGIIDSLSLFNLKLKVAQVVSSLLSVVCFYVRSF